MKIIIRNIIVFCFLISLFSYGASEPEKCHLNQELAGCWVGGLLENDSLTEDIQLRLLRSKPDSTLVLSLIYELGARSRIWEYDIKISCEDNKLKWGAHDGYLSENLDTMYLIKNWKGEISQWMFYRDPDYDDFISQILLNKTENYSYSVPESTNDNLYCASLKDAEIDPLQITAFIKKIKKGQYGDIHSMLIYRKGKLVLEEYFALNGSYSGAFINETYRKKLHHLSSVTKGILSLTTGIAIEQGYISDVNEPVFKYLPDYEDSFSPEEKQIQIRHLLTMTSGWKWSQFKYPLNDDRNDANNLYKSNDVVAYTLDKPLMADPGYKFNYTNGEPTLMGVILSNACGMEVDQFTDSCLFDALGIKQYHWTRYSDGRVGTDGGLKLISRDLLKIGILMLQNGSWQGEQIVSEDWISESAKSKVRLSIRRGYGFYWNEMQYEFGGRSEYATFIPGSGGQFLVIFPSQDMVIVFTAGIYGEDPTNMYWKILNNNILPALKEE